jgi:hypothetical protein
MACVRGAWALATVVLLTARTAEAEPAEQAPTPPDESQLARQVESPVSKLSSVPVRYESNFGIGPRDLARNSVSVLPTVAVAVSPDLSIVSRTTVPFAWQPDVAQGSGYVSGLGDVAESLFFVPRPTSGVLWGIGPSVVLPTASASELGSGQLSAGPTAAILVQPKPFTLGLLVVQLWSIAGESNRPAINRSGVIGLATLHFPSGWYVESQPVITADWNAAPFRNVWTIPVGGGVGKVVYVGEVPIGVSVAAYWNAVRPDTPAAPKGSAEVQIALLLPR